MFRRKPGGRKKPDSSQSVKLTTTPPADNVPLQLLEEATGLAQKFQAAHTETAKLVIEADTLIREQISPTANDRVRAIFTEIKDSHLRYAAKGSGLVAGAQNILSDYRQDDYMTRTQVILTKFRRVDAAKLADDVLLARLGRAWETIESTPSTVDLQVAAVHLVSCA